MFQDYQFENNKKPSEITGNAINSTRKSNYHIKHTISKKVELPLFANHQLNYYKFLDFKNIVGEN